MSSFIDYIENLYHTLDIHRAIIVLSNVNNNDEENQLINQLKDKNHSPLIITDDIHKDEINYDYRLFIIKNPYNLYKFKRDSYNLIIIY